MERVTTKRQIQVIPQIKKKRKSNLNRLVTKLRNRGKDPESGLENIA